ncbi:cdkn1a interacting zinc finger protein 1a isoform X2 [Gadus macrocephalus]|uniref:cdkn1a interacting zinc finger protein 1a isoform X2 n=1 Tax=Gadus macrocephalus TaxID=80720 RepID=UPI0028CB7535|nr:cdkn1a interacting zinc finger protein 1a isoform X2 [Gadus macrocephalus]
MFNPHIHHQQQQQQQQQFHQHLRQIQQLFQQQPPPPPPQPPQQHHVAHHHHHQAQRAMQSQNAPSTRMVNMCQATQTTIIAPNPMLQGALLMQQLQGNMRGFGMGGQQFRQFFSAGARSSLLGPVPMGMTMKSPLMGYPAARHFHPHQRFYNNNNANTSTSMDYRQQDRKRDNEQRAAASANGQSVASITADTSDKAEPGGPAAAEGEAGQSTTSVVDLTDEPAVKKPRTEGSEEPTTITLESDNSAEEGDCSIVEEICSEVLEGTEEAGDAELSDECLADDSVLEEAPEDMDASAQDSQEDTLEGTNKFYCYLCSITCHSQQNFRSHMNGLSHQQRMMEIQHMSNACLVTLLPRVQDSLQAAHKDGKKRAEPLHWCPSCGLHLTCGATDHRCNKEHQQLGSLAGPTCTVCRKTFKTPQLFVEHMRSQQHKHRVEEGKQGFGSLDHKDGCDVEGEERDATHGCYQLDDLSSQTEVTLERMSTDEEFKTDTVYGSRFLVPVAGFLCRLCNKFYHFESSALHSHCKSLTHFEHLKALYVKPDENQRCLH